MKPRFCLGLAFLALCSESASAGTGASKEVKQAVNTAVKVAVAEANPFLVAGQMATEMIAEKVIERAKKEALEQEKREQQVQPFPNTPPFIFGAPGKPADPDNGPTSGVHHSLSELISDLRTKQPMSAVDLEKINTEIAYLLLNDPENIVLLKDYFLSEKKPLLKILFAEILVRVNPSDISISEYLNKMDAWIESMPEPQETIAQPASGYEITARAVIDSELFSCARTRENRYSIPLTLKYLRLLTSGAIHP